MRKQQGFFILISSQHCYNHEVSSLKKPILRDSCFVLTNVKKKRKEKDGPMLRSRCYTGVLQDANRSLYEADHR